MLLKGMPKNESEMTTLPNESPLLLAAQNGHADASLLTY